MQVQSSPYRVRIQNQEFTLPAATAKALKKLDVDGNHVIDDLELAPEVLEESVTLVSNEAADLLQEYKSYVAAVPNPYVSGYYSFHGQCARCGHPEAPRPGRNMGSASRQSRRIRILAHGKQLLA